MFKAKKVKKVEVQAEAETLTPPEAVEETPKEVAFLPMFEGAQVTRIQEAGVVGGRFNHCQMSDGTTKHVPVELFTPRPKTRVDGEYTK